MLFLAPISLIMSWPRRALGRCSPLFHLYVNFWIIWRLFILMFSISWLVILCGLFSSRSPRWRAATRPRSWIHTLYIHYLIISIRYSVNANWFCLSVCPGKAIRPLWPVKRLVFFNQYWKFYLTQIKVVDSGCLRGRCKKTKRAPQRRKCVNVVLKRGHFNMLRPSKGHLRGHFIMFNPPFRHQEGTFAASFRPWKVHHRIYFDTLSCL